tara:strand:+ start:78 stop:674 length:597 start_codon:yes stop_codon:yes gene_type:complete
MTKDFIHCKYCGKKSIGANVLKLSGGIIYNKQDKFCKNCKNYNIHNDAEGAWGDYAWRLWKDAGLTFKNTYKSKLSNLLSMKYEQNKTLAETHTLSINQIIELCNSEKKITHKKIQEFLNNKVIKEKEKNKKEQSKKIKKEKIKNSTLNTLNKGLGWIPDVVWIIILYIMFIALGLYLGLDEGPECGVDYAPRFFGEC